jgi:hypothetical protein
MMENFTAYHDGRIVQDVKTNWGHIGPVMVWRWPGGFPHQADNWGWRYAAERFYNELGAGRVAPMTMQWARAPEYIKEPRP